MEKRDIYIIVVLYKARLADSASFKTLIEPNGISEFFVYDNSPAGFESSPESLPPSVRYVRDTSNSGLSHAYNVGAAHARKLGYRRVLLLDQDTRFASGAWEEYRKNADYPGIVAPLISTCEGFPFSPTDISGLRFRGKSLPKGEYSLRKYGVVNSGCCIPLHLYEEAQGYAEDVPLDYSDFQFQVRARKVFPRFLLMDSSAVQDFSNDCRDTEKLLARFSLYLQSARHFKTGEFSAQLRHNLLVALHAVALSARTRKPAFLSQYVKGYCMGRRRG